MGEELCPFGHFSELFTPSVFSMKIMAVSTKSVRGRQWPAIMVIDVLHVQRKADRGLEPLQVNRI